MTNINIAISSNRWKRETGEEVVSEEVEELEVSSNVTAVLEEIAKEEIDEVDIIMEDINEEIQDLEQSIVVVQKPNNSSPVAPISSSTMAPSSGSTTLQSIMNAKRQRFGHCYENELIKTIQTIPHNLYVSVKLTSLYYGLRLILDYLNP